MKIGLSASMTEADYGRWGEEKYNKLKEHGFSCVDFNLCNTESPLYKMSFDEAEDYLKKERALSESAGITIHQVHGPWRYPPRDLEIHDRAERMEKMKKSIEFCSLLGAKYWVIHPLMPYGLDDIDDNNSQKTWDINFEFMSELSDFAKNFNVTICFENMPFDHFSLSTPERILEFVKAIDKENFKICLDTGHVLLFHELSVPDEVRRLGNEIKVLHTHDNNGLSDEHKPPFSGIIDWCDFSKALRDIDFDGVFSLEPHVPNSLSDDMFEKECIRFYELAQKVLDL